jgi:hypothetical protein
MDWDKIKVGLWGAVGGAVILAMVGFNYGGWVTESAAQVRAKETAANAVTERLGAICVAQLNRDATKSRKLNEMKDKDTWDKGKYIETQSWAIMPGSDKPENGVAEACAKQLSAKS